MSVEQAIKMVISGGIVTPLDTRPKSEQNIPLTSASMYENIDYLREKEGLRFLVPEGSRPGDQILKTSKTAKKPASKK